MTELIPPDLERCQAEKPNGNTFMTLGGTPGLVRCANKPTLLATEKAAGPDGLHGSMSLCQECADVMAIQMPGVATLEKLKLGGQDMIETAMVFDKEGKPIFWLGPKGATGGYIPDSRILWDRVWDARDTVGGVIHTHPWSGSPNPSYKDVTTFHAMETGLGKRLLWAIATMDQVRIFKFDGSYYAPAEDVSFEEESYWINAVRELRELSRKGG
jgi:hypothetical protein